MRYNENEYAVAVADGDDDEEQVEAVDLYKNFRSSHFPVGYGYFHGGADSNLCWSNTKKYL